MVEKRYRIPFVMGWKEYFAKLSSRRLTEDGREIPDPVPMAPPIGYQKQPSMVEHIRALVQSEHLRRAAIEAGAETFEEADDFEIGEDELPNTPWEAEFEPVSELRRRAREAEAAEKSGGSGGTPPPVAPQAEPGARSPAAPPATPPQPPEGSQPPTVRT